LSLSREEQIGTLFDMLLQHKSDTANEQRARIEISNEIQFIKGELKGVARRKDRTFTTTDKIKNMFASRFDTWGWFRDRVLPGLIQLFIVGLLYLVFGQAR